MKRIILIISAVLLTHNASCVNNKQRVEYYCEALLQYIQADAATDMTSSLQALCAPDIKITIAKMFVLQGPSHVLINDVYTQLKTFIPESAIYRSMRLSDGWFTNKKFITCDDLQINDINGNDNDFIVTMRLQHFQDEGMTIEHRLVFNAENMIQSIRLDITKLWIKTMVYHERDNGLYTDSCEEIVTLDDAYWQPTISHCIKKFVCKILV